MNVDLEEITVRDLRRAQVVMRTLADGLPIPVLFTLITADDGDLGFGVPDGLRPDILKRVANFAAWRMALGIVVTYEVDDQYLLSILVARDSGRAAFCRFSRDPITFSRPEIISAAGRLAGSLAWMLPARTGEPTETEIEEAENWFGLRGKFPAIPVYFEACDE
jgi:hypothetical protein